MTVLFRRARVVEVVVHEVDYRWGRERPCSQPRDPLDVAFRRPCPGSHRRERDRFAEAFGVPLSRVQVIAHGAKFRPETTMTRAEARASLGVPHDAQVLLSIGFIQPTKGFDRALRAFAGLGDRARLYVVGSVRVEDAAYVTYVEDLQTLIEQTPGAHLVEGFVSDEMFDRWLVAADALVLPYRHIWSSGVLERAHLYRVPVIVTDVGGLRHQVAGRDDVTVVSNDAALRDAMLERAGVAAAAEAAPWPTEGPHLMHDVQAAVETRAAQRRGGPVRAVALGSSLGGAGTRKRTRAGPPSAHSRSTQLAPTWRHYGEASHHPPRGVDGGAGIRAGQRASAVDNPSARRNGPTASNFVDFRSLRRCCERPG